MGTTPTGADALRTFLNQATATPLLTRDEEHNLFLTIRSGHEAEARLAGATDLTRFEKRRLTQLVEEGKQARERVILANTRLVLYLIHNHPSLRKLPLDDTVQEGLVGLTIAVDRFNADYGTRFATYARWWVLKETRDYLRTLQVSHVPTRLAATASKVMQAREELTARLGHEPDIHDIAEATGLSPDQVHDAQTAYLPPFRPDMPPNVGGDGELPNGWDRVGGADTAEPDFSDTVCDKVSADPTAALSRLPGRQRVVITLRYGLNGERPATHDAIGQKVGMSREWVRRQEAAALKQLRDDPWAVSLSA